MFFCSICRAEHFTDDKCSKLLGELHLHSDVRIMTRDGFTHMFKFAVMSKNNRWELSASSEEERQTWLSMVNKVCNKKDTDDEVQVMLLTETFDESEVNIYANTGAVILDDGSQQLQLQQQTQQQHHQQQQEQEQEHGGISNATAMDSERDNIERQKALAHEILVTIRSEEQLRQNLTLEVLRKQLRAKGELPLEFIPLEELQAEIASIFEKLNKGESFEEDRLDYLLHCLDLNPEHKAKLAKEKEEWGAQVLPFTTACFEEMRGFIPSHIFEASIVSLVDDDGLSKPLAKRFFMKKCLMLVRLVKADISKMHIAELSGRFNPSAQGLDIVELAAIYHSLPEAFLNDHDGKKEQWKSSVEDAFKKLYSQKLSNSLPKNSLRFSGYVNETPFFKDDDKYHSFSKESSATDDSDAFLKVSKRRSDSSVRVVDNGLGNELSSVKTSPGSTTCNYVPSINKKSVGRASAPAGKINSGDLLSALKSRKSANAASSEGRAGGGDSGPDQSQSMQDELKNVLKRRSVEVKPPIERPGE